MLAIIVLTRVIVGRELAAANTFSVPSPYRRNAAEPQKEEKTDAPADSPAPAGHSLGGASGYLIKRR